MAGSRRRLQVRTLCCARGRQPLNQRTQPPAGATVTAVQTPAITLSKRANPTTYSAEGQVITYTFRITNTGNVTLSGPFSVSDNRLGAITPCGSGPLAPNAATSCTATHVVTEADMGAGSIADTATASTTFGGSPVISPSAGATLRMVPLAVTLADFGATYQGGFVLVTWETTAELNNQGFRLYRSGSAQGPWTLISPPPFIASASPGMPGGQPYSFEDHRIFSNGFYYYRLDSVDLQGTENTEAIARVHFGTHPPYGDIGDGGFIVASTDGASVTVKWQTRVEPNVVSYHLYKATDQTGPWLDYIHAEPACNTPAIGCLHTFVDTAVIAGQVYWYLLHEVYEPQYTAERSGPISSAPALSLAKSATPAA